MRIKLLLFLYISFTFQCIAQNNILDDPVIQSDVENCLNAIYGWDFLLARELQESLASRLPDHPAPDFLDALITYWNHFPLLPEETEVKDFTSSIEKTIIKAEGINSGEDPSDFEGVFFDMHARAFRGMFWADNGKPLKVLMDLDDMYRQTMKGIEFKEDFSEFYFSSGLYNYYIEAYVDAHPIYKPIASLFRKGDKKTGLQELNYAIENTTYIRNEAILFMSLLQLNYEQNLDLASDYAAMLYNLYPENIYYHVHYAIILLHKEDYLIGELLVERLLEIDHPFAEMTGSVLRGFISENKYNRQNEALTYYRNGIEKAESFGPIADIYKAIGLMGASRISASEGDFRRAQQFKRKSISASSYTFISEFPYTK